MMDDDSEFIPIIADGDDSDLGDFVTPDKLPILPLRNTVLFPGVVLPITVGRKKIVAVGSGSLPGKSPVGYCCLKKMDRWMILPRKKSIK